jgi:hypothetical protein
MLHKSLEHLSLEHLNSQKGWQWWLDNYETMGFETCYGRLLLRKNRRENPVQFLNDIAIAYKKAQKQNEEWRAKNISSVLDEAKKRSENGRIVLHCKPTHKFEPCENCTWWAYKYEDYGSPYGWGYSFDWIEEPEEKLNHDLGQALYKAEQKSEKYNSRVFSLGELLKRELSDYLLKIYPYKWLDENQFSEKLVKFNLQGDQYWYKIGRSHKGVPVWENFIWQNNKIEEINL